MKELKAIDFRLFIGCPCYITDTDNPVPSTIEGIDGMLNMVISERVNYPPSLIKPILRRFETLSRDEIEQLNKLWPNEKISRTVTDSIRMDAQIINFLTLLHIDVFSWVEQGLAIDAAYNSMSN
jgi:hypothetical protein